VVSLNSYECYSKFSVSHFFFALKYEYIGKKYYISRLFTLFGWFKKRVQICGNKMPTRCNRGFYCRSIACSTCFGHQYAHHQELKSIIQWLLPVVFRAVVFKLLVWCGAEGNNTLELLIMGILVPETC